MTTGVKFCLAETVDAIESTVNAAITQLEAEKYGIEDVQYHHDYSGWSALIRYSQGKTRLVRWEGAHT